MTYFGHVKNGVVVLEDCPHLPEGAAVTVELKTDIEAPECYGAPTGDAAPIGSARAILEAMRTAPKVSKGDVDELEHMIEEGKLPVRYDSPFEDEEG
jgi:hypothetical protein